MLKFVLLPECTDKISHLIQEKGIFNLIKFKENFITSAINKVGLQGDKCGLGEAEHCHEGRYFYSQSYTFSPTLFREISGIISSIKPGFPVWCGNRCLDLQCSRVLLNALYCSTHVPPAKLF